MRKLLLFSLVLLFFTACSDSAESPIIEVIGFSVNDEPINYADKIDLIPSLHIDDEVTISLKLDGNGEELNTFLVKEEVAGADAQTVAIHFEGLPEGQLSNDKEFTDKENGKLGFKDGISQTFLELKAKVNKIADDKVTLRFYLFSKPADCEGAKYELILKMKKEVTD